MQTLRGKIIAGEGTRRGVVFSGGVDSTTLLYYLLSEGHEVHTFSFLEAGGEATNSREGLPVRTIVAKLCRFDYHHAIGFPDTDQLLTRSKFADDNQQTNTYIPGYKMLMQTAVMAFAEKLGLDYLHFGNNVENTAFEDEMESSINKVAATYNDIYGTRLEVFSPFQNLEQHEVVQLGHELGVPFEYTLSCSELHMPGLVHCGKCSCCKTRKLGFKQAGVEDPTWYKE